MKFDDLDARMRVYETAHDQIIPADVFPVARLDGRDFTRLTKEVLSLEAPFDAGFRDAMAAVVRHLMECGFKVLYGYTQSDEISLLFDPAEIAFGRKVRKYNSILAGEASARLSLLLGEAACFDSRICELPSPALVADYFRWRQEDARRVIRARGETIPAIRQRLREDLELPSGEDYGLFVLSALHAPG